MPKRPKCAPIVAVLAMLSSWSMGPPSAAAQRAPRWEQTGLRGIRGVTVGPIESSQQPGRGYGTESSAVLLDELASMGVNWISLTPFGRVWSLTSTTISMDFEAPWSDTRDAIARMVAQAHARGIRVLIVPHLWVETGGWRGEMDPGDPQRWASFHEAYSRFVLHWALDAASSGADAFSIGVECKSWSGRFGDFWTELIALVRARFHGLLTYSANWDEAEAVLFWDQLDFVGINAFYPLADAPGAPDGAYVEGALRWVADVESLAAAVQRPVVFVEVGYTSRPNAAVEPWLWPDDMEAVRVDETEQARALAAMFAAFHTRPWFGGSFLWRYYASIDDVSQEAAWGFSPHGKQLEAWLPTAFRALMAADPDPLSMGCLSGECPVVQRRW